MKHHILSCQLSVVMSLLSLGLILGSTLANGGEQVYPVQSVEDGDTLVVLIAGNPERIQLLGIDAPEDVDNAKLQRDLQRTGLDAETLLTIGAASTRHLQQLIAPGQRVELLGNLKQRDRYGRIPVIAFDPDGRSLNAAMVEDGYAVILNRYPLKTAFKAQLEGYEKSALRETRGLWGSHSATTSAWSGRSK